MLRFRPSESILQKKGNRYGARYFWHGFGSVRLTADRIHFWGFVWSKSQKNSLSERPWMSKILSSDRNVML